MVQPGLRGRWASRGALARSHPATDLPRNADDAAAVTGQAHNHPGRGGDWSAGVLYQCSYAAYCAEIGRTLRCQVLQRPRRVTGRWMSGYWSVRWAVRMCPLLSYAGVSVRLPATFHRRSGREA
jgi:hypothetical protein